jgi:hypothetical protein
VRFWDVARNFSVNPNGESAHKGVANHRIIFNRIYNLTRRKLLQRLMPKVFLRYRVYLSLSLSLSLSLFRVFLLWCFCREDTCSRFSSESLTTGTSSSCRFGRQLPILAMHSHPSPFTLGAPSSFISRAFEISGHGKIASNSSMHFHYQRVVSPE